MGKLALHTRATESLVPWTPSGLVALVVVVAGMVAGMETLGKEPRIGTRWEGACIA